MHSMIFMEPVCLASEKNPAGSEIEDLEQALQFLRDWPVNRRGPVYDAAYNACSAARDGRFGVEEARKSLSGFARITGILQNKPARIAAIRAAGVGSIEKGARTRP